MPEVGQVRLAGVEAVGRAAVETFGNFGESARAARRQHAHHFTIFVAHARHDLPRRVELAELPAHVALDGVELVTFLLGVEGERSIQVVIARDRGEFLAPLREEIALDRFIPLDGVEDADGALRFHEPIAERANHRLVGRQSALKESVGGEFSHYPVAMRGTRGIRGALSSLVSVDAARNSGFRACCGLVASGPRGVQTDCSPRRCPFSILARPLPGVLALFGDHVSNFSTRGLTPADVPLAPRP